MVLLLAGGEPLGTRSLIKCKLSAMPGIFEDVQEILSLFKPGGGLVQNAYGRTLAQLLSRRKTDTSVSKHMREKDISAVGILSFYILSW